MMAVLPSSAPRPTAASSAPPTPPSPPAAALPRGLPGGDTSTEATASHRTCNGADSADARGLLREIQSEGFMVELSQTLLPQLSTPIVVYLFQVDMFTTARLASQSVQGNL